MKYFDHLLLIHIVLQGGNIRIFLIENKQKFLIKLCCNIWQEIFIEIQAWNPKWSIYKKNLL